MSAISCVVAPWYPRSAKTWAAASMISTERRWVFRFEGRPGSAETARRPGLRRHLLALTDRDDLDFIYKPIDKAIQLTREASMIKNPKGRPPFRADHVGSLLRPPV